MMSKNNTFIIAKEGWKYLVGSVAAFIVFSLMDADWLQVLTVVTFIALAYTYRNPERIVPHYQTGSIVAPVDGKISAVEALDECGVLGGSCYKITIQSGCFDMSLLRAPMDASVEKIDYRHGSRLSLKKPLAHELNERALVYLNDLHGNQLAVEHLLAQSPDGITLYIAQKQKVVQGARYGLMVKGRHIFYLPKHCDIKVQSGDRLRAGETLLGYFS